MRAVMNNLKTKRVDFTLPIETITLLGQAVPRGKRSELVDQALRVYIRHLKQKDLQQTMRKEALADADDNLQIVEEWSAVDNETWKQIR